jgi:Flp pilus assembly protein TadB
MKSPERSKPQRVLIFLLGIVAIVPTITLAILFPSLFAVPVAVAFTLVLVVSSLLRRKKDREELAHRLDGSVKKDDPK